MSVLVARGEKRAGKFYPLLCSLLLRMLCCFCIYMNCSKYFSLKPVSGNLNTFCLPSFVV